MERLMKDQHPEEELRIDAIPEEEFELLDESEKDSEFVAMESKTYFQDAWSRFTKNKLALVSFIFLMIMALTIFYGAFIIICNIVTDLITAALDPRIRLK